jgi:uncharacterized membrane protein YidH (DUF202 family)
MCPVARPIFTRPPPDADSGLRRDHEDMKARQERTLWETGIALVVTGVALSAILIALVRFTDVPDEPWLYLGIVIGIFSAMAGGALAFIRARELSD